MEDRKFLIERLVALGYRIQELETKSSKVLRIYLNFELN